VGAIRSRQTGIGAGQTLIVDSERFASLSPREVDVLNYAAAGLIDKEIGVKIGVTLNTLRSYWGRIRGKVGEAPRAAIVAGFVERSMRDQAKRNNAVYLNEDWELDLESDTMFASDSINDTHGLARGVAHPRSSYSNRYHPDDAARVRAAIDSALRGNENAYHMSFRLLSEEGIEHVSLLIVVGRDAYGKAVKWYGHRLRTSQPPA